MPAKLPRPVIFAEKVLPAIPKPTRGWTPTATAVLTDDALGVLENVEVGYYHNYQIREVVGFDQGLGI